MAGEVSTPARRSGDGGGEEVGEEAWNELVRRVEPRLVRIGRRLGVREEDVEDEVQSIWLRLVEKGEVVRHPEAWAVGRMRWRCRELGRPRKRVEVPRRPSGGGRLEWSGRVELHLDLRRAWRGLRRRHRILLWVRYVEGMTEPEAARVCGYRIGSVGQITKRVLDGLRRTLGVIRHDGRRG
ncbi:MAG: sigma-70 family RNA polymerase sigma factor [bacterium]